MNYEMTPCTFMRASFARSSVATMQSMRRVHSQSEDGTSCSPGMSSFTRSRRSIHPGNDDNMCMFSILLERVLIYLYVL